jgi:hypothetical protein
MAVPRVFEALLGAIASMHAAFRSVEELQYLASVDGD